MRYIRKQYPLLLQIFVLDRVLEEDGITGDAYGPYDTDFVVEERQRVAREKVHSQTLPADASGFRAVGLAEIMQILTRGMKLCAHLAPGLEPIQL